MSPTSDVMVVGTGAQARYVIDIANEVSAGLTVRGLIDIERRENVGLVVNGVPVSAFLDDYLIDSRDGSAEVVVAYGDSKRKREACLALERAGFRFATAVSRSAYVSPSARIGEGSIINPCACVMANAVIGRHAILHAHATVEHDCRIGDWTNIGPGASLAGGVSTGEGSYLYTGSAVVPSVSIGSWAVVGAGSVVLHDVGDHEVVAGVPARLVSRGGA